MIAGAGPRQVADGVHVGRLGPGPLINVVVVADDAGDLVVDSGLRWSRGRLAQMLVGRTVAGLATVSIRPDLSDAWCPV